MIWILLKNEGVGSKYVRGTPYRLKKEAEHFINGVKVNVLCVWLLVHINLILENCGLLNRSQKREIFNKIFFRHKTFS